MESVLIFFATGCLAVALVGGLGSRIYYTFSKKKPPRYLAVVLLCLVGIFGTVFGSVQVYDIRTSSTVHTTGLLTSVSLVHSKGDHYWFTLATVDGQYRLSTNYGGPGIENGEIVEVSFLEKPSTITYLRVLDPPQHRGVVLHESDGSGDAIFLLFFGIVAFFGALALGISLKRTKVPNP